MKKLFLIVLAFASQAVIGMTKNEYNLPWTDFSQEWSELDEAILLNRPELLERKDIVNRQDANGNTPLHGVVATFRWERICFLLRVKSLNPNLQNNEGDTPLMIAAKLGFHQAVNELIHHPKINLNLKNKKNLDALGLAKLYNRKTCIELLEAATSNKQNFSSTSTVGFRQFAFNNIKQMCGIGSDEHLKILCQLDIRVPEDNRVTTKHFCIEKNELKPTYDSCREDIGRLNQAVKHYCTICFTETTKKCSQCKQVYYCSRRCQQEDWGYHKLVCQKQ